MSFAVDRERNTYWSTEQYQGAQLNKEGVGLYIDARPSVSAKALTVRTETPGWTAQVFAARDKVPQSWPDPAWRAVSGRRRIDRDKTRIDLDTADRAFRYYLIWITSLPPGGEVKINEVYLYREG